MPDMQFIEASAHGGPEVLRLATGPVPVPKADEVLIRVMAAGVNRPDVSQRAGSYPPPPGASQIIGLEVAGEVVALGGAVSRFRVGEKVCALANGGGYAEFCAAPQTQTLAWPEGFDAIRAAAVPETYFTVWANLFMLGRLAKGESVLVHGGTSGIGVTALQLAREFGASAFATAGSDEKVAAVERLGAVGINYRTADFLEVVQARTDGRGVDVVLDMVGAPYFPRNLRCLALDGRLVMIAFLQGSKLDGVNLQPIMTRRLTVTGSTMRPRTTAQKAAIADQLRAKVWPVLAAGRCGPIIHQVFPLAEAAAAHRLLESSAHIGKIVLSVAD
jgi:NADPH2:quinone reductase